MTLLLNRELVSRVKYVWLVFSQILSKIVPKIRNLPEISLRGFENVGPESQGKPSNYSHRDISYKADRR